MKPLPRRFYARDCLVVAPELVGCHLVHRTRRGLLRGRIVEVEAYVHEEDQACHARFGKTPRSLLLFGQPGYSYVFLIYGMYDQFNVVCEPEGSPAAVLIRALEPEPPLDGGTDGPGKLCRALGITRAHNGLDLVSGDQIWLEPREKSRQNPRIVATPRIGIDYAGEWADKPWRFIDADSKYVSKRRPAKAATKEPPKATVDKKKT
ncbi:MAG TPA: DNA-3-methyladenine glycosylase [Polyangia bacterium]|jgi:DNA-3-methyladenine glycosylase|nr:DNA-3-methyladenine glycosylase [Polyangia bacterium]